MLHIDILDFYAGGVYILIVLLTVNRFVVFRPIITDVIIGVRAGGARGGGGGGGGGAPPPPPPPPKFWATQILWAAREKIWAKPAFKDVFMFLY